MTARAPRSRAADLRERSVVFSGAEVGAALDGRKWQFRRVVDLSRVGFTPSWVGWVDHPDDGPGWYAQDVDQPYGEDSECWGEHRLTCPFGQPGGRLWCRETWAVPGTVARSDDPITPGMPVVYRADGEDPYSWRSPVTMPRWACRLVLDPIVEVRVQRLQEISEADILAEGVEDYFHGCYSFDYLYLGYTAARANFRRFWDETQGKRPGCSWNDSRWVWCVSYRKLDISEPTP